MPTKSGGTFLNGLHDTVRAAAKEAAKDREVIAIIGDGRFQMTLQELATIKQENLAVKTVLRVKPPINSASAPNRAKTTIIKPTNR